MFPKLVLPLLVLFQFTISVDVDLVLFNVTVLDKDGRAVSGLSVQSFQVLEDGRPEQIKIFQPEDTPSTVGLVIDNSGSMTNKRSDVVTAATAFVGASHPEDEMFIVNFSANASLALPETTPFTNNRMHLGALLSQTTARGTTALYDALELALEHLERGTRQRKALVLLSDGGDNASFSSLDEVLGLAQRSSATVFCIGIYDRNQRDRNPDVLKRIAKLTGGEAYFPRTPADLKEVWPKIARSIRGQYTIGYLSSNSGRDGAYRKVVIKAVDKRGKALDVRSRPGYAAASAQ